MPECASRPLPPDGRLSRVTRYQSRVTHHRAPCGGGLDARRLPVGCVKSTPPSCWPAGFVLAPVAAADTHARFAVCCAAGTRSESVCLVCRCHLCRCWLVQQCWPDRPVRGLKPLPAGPSALTPGPSPAFRERGGHIVCHCWLVQQCLWATFVAWPSSCGGCASTHACKPNAAQSHNQ